MTELVLGFLTSFRNPLPSMAALAIMGRSRLWLLALLALLGASQLAGAQQTAMQDSKPQKRQVIRASLVHRDHPDSPLRVPGATAAERFHAANARENTRMALRRDLVEFNTSIFSGKPENQAEYLMTLYLGTPAQRFFLIVDTGSNLLWVQCLPCIHCYTQTNPRFDRSKSSTYSAISCSNCRRTLAGERPFCNSDGICEIRQYYGTPGSELRGQLSTETISFKDASNVPSVPNILFGCMNNNTASFGRTDGLVGFGRGANSLPNQLNLLNSINVFSYCLVPFEVSDTLTSDLVFGVPEDPNNMQLAYTPILSDQGPTFYYVSMTGIAVGGVKVDLSRSTSLVYNRTTNAGGTLLDSGGTFLRLREDIWTPVTTALEALISYPRRQNSYSSICYDTSGESQVVFPTMTLQFAGLDGTTTEDFELRPGNLFTVAGDNVYCLAGALAGPTRGNVIGNVAQANHYIVTDLENMKIGWKSQDCSVRM